MVLETFVDPNSGLQWKVRLEISPAKSEHYFALKYEELLSSFEMVGHLVHPVRVLSNIPFLSTEQAALPLLSLNGQKTPKLFSALQRIGALRDSFSYTMLGAASIHDGDFARKR